VSKIDRWGRGTVDDDAGDTGVNRAGRTCPTTMEILELALGIRQESNDRVSRHVRSCERCQLHVDSLRGILGEIAAFEHGSSARTGECLDEAALAEIVEGRGPLELTQARLEHVAGCLRCRGSLASLLDLLGDEHVSRELQRLETPQLHRPRRSWRSAFANRGFAGWIAAAAAVLVFLGIDRQLAHVRRHRAPTEMLTDTLALAYPIGNVESATAFSWRSVREPNVYRLTLFDAGGHALYERDLTDTALALPDSVVVMPHQSYFWMVEARIGQGHWLRSRLEEFRTNRSRAP